MRTNLSEVCGRDTRKVEFFEPLETNLACQKCPSHWPSRCWGNEDLDASRDAGLTADETISFERHDHLVDRWRADLKVALHIGLGWRAPEHVRIGIDESQVLALLFGEALSREAARGA